EEASRFYLKSYRHGYNCHLQVYYFIYFIYSDLYRSIAGKRTTLNLFLFNIFLYIPLLTRRYYRFRSTFYSRLDRLFYDENGQAKITILNFMENGRLSNNYSVTYFYSFFVFLSSGHA